MAAALADTAIVAAELDVSRADSVRNFGELCADRVGRIDLVVNNAGIGAGPGSILDGGPDAFEAQLQTHVVGALRVVHALLPLLEPGAVVANISSVLASIDSLGPSFSGYAAAKCAQNALTRQLAAALRNRGVACLAVHPGWVRTRLGGPNAPLTPEESARELAGLLLAADLADTDRFVDYRGAALRW